MNQRNYQKELDGIIEGRIKEGVAPRLLLHSCCAPCSSYVLEYLSRYFQITVYYYNPNIYPVKEYWTRLKEQRSLIDRMDLLHPVQMQEGAYEPEEFYHVTKELKQEPEGGNRCLLCYGLRLRETAKVAKASGYDYFTTTLTISPLKSAVRINEIGEALGAEYQVKYLPSDFKKRDGYKRSIALSEEYGLYRQDYCGCIYSIRT